MRTPPDVPVIEFINVTRRWRAGILGATHESLALENVSFRVAPGEVIAVTGAPGAGKSTLLLLAAGQAAPTDGSVRWRGGGDPVAVRPQLIGARPWEYHFLTVRQALAFHADVLALKDDALAAPTRFVPLMARVGLRGRSRTRLGQLDAIDRLRVVIAQALLARPSLICCEEPFAFCGPEERREGVRLLRSIAANGIALLLATREAATLAAYGLADRTFPLERGRLGPAPRVMRSVLELAVPSPEDAMARLASRLPSLARRGRRLRVPLFGRTPEAILALCRDVGVQVRASRVAEEGTGPEPRYPTA
ncbi:MAG: ATP-binding cassette domain-containing protein [Gemmatimonadaceae bacterium]